MTDPTGVNPHDSTRPDAGRHAAEAAAPAVEAGLPPAGQPPRRLPVWIAPVALALAVFAALLSFWAIKTASDNAPVGLAGESKVRVCSAFATVSKAISLQTNGGAEPVPEALAATNSRQALLAGGDYLMQQLDAKTPSDLADAVSAFANDVQVLGLNYLGGAVSTDQSQTDLIKKADAAMARVSDLCA